MEDFCQSWFCVHRPGEAQSTSALGIGAPLVVPESRLIRTRIDPEGQRGYHSDNHC